MSTSLLLWLVKFNLILIALSAVYFLAFSKINTPKLKRWFLLLSPAAACLFPFISFSTPVDGTLAATLLPEAVVGRTTTAPEDFSRIFPIAAYLTVAVLMAIRLILGLIKLDIIKRSSTINTIGGVVVAVNPTLTHTFSFAGNVYTPSLPIADDVLKHEQIHIQLGHGYDKAWFGLLKVVLWFNPAVYLFSNWSSDNHEFEVDSRLLDQGVDEYEYSRILIGHALNGAGLQLTNSFSQLQILKTRIHMMKTKAPQFAAWRTLIAVPAVALSLIAAQACDKGPETRTSTAPGTPVQAVTGEKSVDKPAEFPGGSEEMMKYLATNIKYPESAVKSKTEGTVYISFIVESNGTISNAKVMRGVTAELDTEALKVISSMPEWTPAYKNRQAIASEFTVPIKFKL